MGQSATLVPQTTLRVLDNSLFIGNCLYPTVGDLIPLNQGYSYGSSQTIYTVPAMTNISPVVSLITSSNVTACKPLTLTIQVTSGLANRLPNQVGFSCISGQSFDPTTQSQVSASVTIINSNLNSIMSTWTTPQLSITLPANLMISNAQYKFIATITNYLKASTMANASVTTSNVLYPTVSIQGIPSIIYPSMIFSVYIKAYLQACDNSTSSTDPTLYTYTLTQLTPTNKMLNISTDYVFDSVNTIKFNQYRLTPGTNYSFNINVKLTSNQLLSTDTQFQFVVQAQNPIAIISGSDQYIGAKQNITLCANQSYDRIIYVIIFLADQNSTLSFIWTCMNYSTNSFCYTTYGTTFSLPDSSQNTFNASIFPAGSQLQFSLTVCKIVSTLRLCSNSFIQKVFISTQDTIDQLQLDSTGKNGMIVNIQDPVLVGTISVSTTQTYEYLWDIGNLSASVFQDLGAGNIYNMSYIRIKPYSLSVNNTYPLKLSRFSKSTMQNMSIQINITVNNPPNGGALIVNPLSGVEHTTPFTLEAVSWTDFESNYPLSYKFGFRNVANSSIQYVSTIGLASSCTVYLPTNLNNQVELWVEVYDSLGAMTNYSVSVSVTNSTLDVSSAILARIQSDSISTPSNFVNGVSEFVSFINEHKNDANSSSYSLSLLQGNTCLLYF